MFAITVGKINDVDFFIIVFYGTQSIMTACTFSDHERTTLVHFLAFWDELVCFLTTSLTKYNIKILHSHQAIGSTMQQSWDWGSASRGPLVGVYLGKVCPCFKNGRGVLAEGFFLLFVCDAKERRTGYRFVDRRHCSFLLIHSANIKESKLDKKRFIPTKPFLTTTHPLDLVASLLVKKRLLNLQTLRSIFVLIPFSAAYIFNTNLRYTFV